MVNLTPLRERLPYICVGFNVYSRWLSVTTDNQLGTLHKRAAANIYMNRRRKVIRTFLNMGEPFGKGVGHSLGGRSGRVLGVGHRTHSGELELGNSNRTRRGGVGRLVRSARTRSRSHQFMGRQAAGWGRMGTPGVLLIR